MGVFSFIKNAGAKVFGIGKTDKEEAAEAAAAEMKMEEMRMEFAPTGFDFICYNSCKDRNDEAFCRQKCSIQ